MSRLIFLPRLTLVKDILRLSNQLPAKHQKRYSLGPQLVKDNLKNRFCSSGSSLTRTAKFSFAGPLQVPVQTQEASWSPFKLRSKGTEARSMASENPEVKLQHDEQMPGLRNTPWDQQDLKPQYSKLEEKTSADVVVVGGGIAGLSVAYSLVNAGKSVVVLEARCIGSGMTGRTTAHLMPWNDDYYYHLEDMFGHAKTQLVAESHRKSIDWIEKVVKEEKIDCKFKRLDGYLFPHDDSKNTMDKLHKEFEASKGVGFNDISMVDLQGDPSYGSIHTAIKWPNAGEFHPLMYINGLASAIVKKGGRIFESSQVFEQSGTTVTTADKKGEVKAEAVVLATNSPINHDLLVHARQKADRSYVIGLRVNKGKVKRATWWDTADPYHYVRLEDKQDHDVLIVGGEDHETGIRPKNYYDAWSNLENWARKRWPAAKDVIYRWTGQVYEPIDSLGLYGKDPASRSNTYIATGDSGEGMTGGTIAGIVISSEILGQDHPWAKIYSPSKLPPASVSTLQEEFEEMKKNVEGFGAYIPYVRSDHVDIEDLSPGCGAILQEGLHKVAAYRDPEGKLHRYTAVCPHMKCIVQWNPNDATFDCPCHGSQFDCYGRLVNGPAKANLKPL